MTESASDRVALLATWQSLSRLAATALGAGTALFALVQGLGVPVACLRGGLTWLGALVVARAGGVLVARSLREPRPTRAEPANAPRTRS